MRSGFTLIEVLIVIAIIAILAAVVIVAINPGRQFKQANNSSRWSHVNTILDSVHQYMVDNNGVPPFGTSGAPFGPLEICNKNFGEVKVCTGMVDLSTLSDNQRYVVKLPVEPLPALKRLEWHGTAYGPPDGDLKTDDTGIGYSISKTQFDRITVHASSTELLNETYNGGNIIKVER